MLSINIVRYVQYVQAEAQIFGARFLRRPSLAARSIRNNNNIISYHEQFRKKLTIVRSYQETSVKFSMYHQLMVMGYLQDEQSFVIQQKFCQRLNIHVNRIVSFQDISQISTLSVLKTFFELRSDAFFVYQLNNIEFIRCSFCLLIEQC